MFENPRRGRQARNFTTNVPKIADRKSSSEQIFSENCRWVPLSYFVLPQNETRAPIKTPAWEANLYVSIFSSYGGSASRTLRYKHSKHNY